MSPEKRKSESQSAFAATPVFISIVLFIVTLAVFWPVSKCDFLNYDDDGYVTANAHVRQGLTIAGVKWAFVTGETANWHPLTWLSLMLDAQLFGRDAADFHLTNLFLHALNVVLLFLLFNRLTRASWRSAFVAALFALHPLHVESVAWVSERKDVLSGFCFMLTLLAYARFAAAKGQSAGSKTFYFLALIFFALGLMAKPMLVTLPFVLLLLDFWPLQRFHVGAVKNVLIEKIPFFILSAAGSVVTYIVQKNGEAVQTLASFPLKFRIENAVLSYGRYLEKLFWPANLATPYPYPDHWPNIVIIISIAIVVGGSWAAIRWAQKFSFLFTGWFWFLGMLVPVIGLVQVGTQAMADRYTYLPSIGIFLVATWGAAEIARRISFPKMPLAILIILVIAASAMQTRKQIGYWQNSGTLFRHAIAVTKNNAEAYDHLGTYFMRITGDVDQAANCYQQAVTLAPSKLSSRINFGSALLLEGKRDAAAEQFNAALQLSPQNAEANCDFGFILASQGRFNEAISYYDKAIQAKPDFASAYHDRGLAFAATGEWQKAIRDYREAIRLDPNHASTHTHLGVALRHENQVGEALGEFTEALRLNPNDAEAREQLQQLQK